MQGASWFPPKGELAGTANLSVAQQALHQHAIWMLARHRSLIYELDTALQAVAEGSKGLPSATGGSKDSLQLQGAI